MPSTARDLKLNIVGNDEREDLYKSTDGAARLLSRYYEIIFNLTKVHSWILTAAAYNNGPGNIKKSVLNSKTTNYFNLQLNKETAEYVYRIVAVKELFEHPEYYMKDFGFNIFSEANKNRRISTVQEHVEFEFDNSKWKKEIRRVVKEEKVTRPFAARVVSDFDNGFDDGKVVFVELLEPLSTQRDFIQKGERIGNPGYVIDGRVFINLGYPGFEVMDETGQKGIALSELKKGTDLLINVTTKTVI